ncbi:MAG: hypothetical protein VX300_00900, partial [Acidobacteriota bacterium]|nr:hypothetical protein [Acidobacteriota bacterium]
MRKKKFCVVLAIFTIALAATTDATGNDRYQAGGPPGQIALTHGNVIDVRSGEILRDVTVLVSGGIISEVGADNVPPGYQEISLGGAYL